MFNNRKASWAIAILALIAFLVVFMYSEVEKADAADHVPTSVQSQRINENLSYMEFGDSISAGIGTSNPPVTAFPTQAKVRALGIGLSCIVPINCDPTKQVLSWWPAYVDKMANPPKVAIFMIGTNDYPSSTASQIEVAMRKLQKLGDDRDIRVVFGTITPAPAGSFWNVGHNGIAKDVRLEVNEYIRTHPRIRGPEYARALQCGQQDLCPQFIGPMDDVHFGDAGAKAAGNVLRDWIKSDLSATTER